jgi:hypothetical protein
MGSKIAYCTNCEWVAHGDAGDRRLNQAMIEHVGATEHEVDSERR